MNMQNIALASLGTKVTEIMTETCWTPKTLGKYRDITMPARITEAGKAIAKAQLRGGQGNVCFILLVGVRGNFFFFFTFLFIFIFIFIQLQLSAFSPHPSTPPQPVPPPSPTSTLPLDFVLVSYVAPQTPLPTILSALPCGYCYNVLNFNVSGYILFAFFFC